MQKLIILSISLLFLVNCGGSEDTPTEIAVDASCGTAEKSYSHEDTSFGSRTFCDSGDLSGTIPQFPDYGTSISWSCVSENGAKGSQCEASREQLPVLESKLLSNYVELGPISGASVTIQPLDENYNLYGATTNNNAIYKVDAGLLLENLKGRYPDENYPTYLLVSATGGYDLDPNDDGVREEGEQVALLGTVRGIIKTETLLNEEEHSINLISTAIAELLSEEQFITEEKIAYIAELLGVDDINSDGKIDNLDVLEYKMSEHQSQAEDILREQFLAAIHNNDNAQLISIIQSLTDKLGLVFMSYELFEDHVRINLNPANDNSKINYSINAKQGGLLTETYSEPILLFKNQYVVYQECGSENYCSELQIAAFNGVEVKPYFTTSVGYPVDMDIDYNNELRSSLIQKSIENSTLSEQISKNKIDMSSVLQEKFTLNEKLKLIEEQVIGL